MSTRLLDFYRQEKRDSEHRTLNEIWNWSDERFEICHDFIQWLFPLNEPSAVNPDAPLVTDEDQTAFRKEAPLQISMRKSFTRFLAFLGLAITDGDRVTKAKNFTQRHSIWNYSNHNWLRITRVLKSLRLLGFDKEAKAFWICLKDLHENDGFVSENSFEYWRNVAEGTQTD